MAARCKRLIAVASLALPLGLVTIGCNPSAERTERWTSTENTNVPIDWDKVNEAYKLADGPEDLERRVNEIYGGSEVISIAVADLDDKTQLVTGFFDKNTNGAVDEAEKIFTIRRELSGNAAAQYQTVGYGPYYGYHSPLFSIASGMLMGSMMSRMFTPGYAPMYQQPYATPGSRVADMQQTRSSYRAANPSEFQQSKSGLTYGRPTTTRGPRGEGRYGGGGRFGVVTKGRARRLDA